MYLSYGDYLNMGGAIDDETAYERYAPQADALITRMTHGRILSESPVRPCVQYAAFALTEAMQADAESGANGCEIASVTNDGVSVAYVSGSASPAQIRAQRYGSIVRRYLQCETDANGTPILYAGVDA